MKMEEKVLPSLTNTQPEHIKPVAEDSADQKSTDEQTYSGSKRSEFISLRTRELMWQEVSRGDIKELLKKENQKRCKPPLGDKTLEKQIETTFRETIKDAVADGNGARYEDHDNGIFEIKGHGDKMTPHRLTTFTVLSMQEIVSDDGTGQTVTSFDITGKVENRTENGRLTAEDFNKMQWPMSMLGPQAAVLPRHEARARFGIQMTANKLAPVRLYTSTGWRSINGEWMYLHAGGAITKGGADEKIKATLPTELQPFDLPSPPEGEELKRAAQASLNFINVAADAVSIPLLASVYRAPLPDAAFTVFTTGRTGTLKTSTALVAQQHFGAGFTEEKIPHWASTDNHNLELLFIAKDAMLIVDDFVLSGGRFDKNKKQESAENLIRSVNNRAGRGRLGKDMKIQDIHPPRALMLATGEQRPDGHSLAARTVHMSIRQRSVKKEVLTQCQTDAKAGLLAQSMSAYLKWLAPHYEALKDLVESRTNELRGFFAIEGRHLKSAENLASLAAGFELFLTFLFEKNVISTEEADKLWIRMWEALVVVGSLQDEYQADEDPAKDALRLLYTAYENGQLCLLAVDEEEFPKPACSSPAIELGWKETGKDGGEVWLAQPDTLFKFITDHYEKQEKSFPWDRKTLLERWAQDDYTETNDRNLYKVRVKGKQRRLVRILPSAFDRVFEEDKNSRSSQVSVIPSRKMWLRDDSVSSDVPTVPTPIPSDGNSQATDAARVN